MMKTDKTMDKYIYITGWIFLGMAAAFGIGLHFGLMDLFKTMSHCVFHRITGLYCPGCGGTRAVTALFHGKILVSLYYHPVVVYTAVFGGWFMLSQTIERLSGGKLKIGMHYRDLYLWLALMIVVLNCFIKNIVLVLTGTALMA